MHPCGTVRDVLRRGYRTKMCFYQGGPYVPVRWFRAPEGAQVASGPSVFVSRIFQKDKNPELDWVVPEGTPGEITPANRKRPWNVGNNPVGYTGQSQCGSARAWNGLANLTEDPPLVLDANGYSMCCGNVVVVAAGGVEIGGTGRIVTTCVVLNQCFEICADWYLCAVVLPLTSGENDNVALPALKPMYLLEPVGPASVTGIIPTNGQQIICLLNITPYTVTFKQAASTTLPTQPLYLPGSRNVYLQTNAGIILWDDPTAKVWRCLGVIQAPAQVADYTASVTGPLGTLQFVNSFVNVVQSTVDPSVIQVTIPDASVTNSGVVNTSLQKFNGIKTFTETLYVDDLAVDPDATVMINPFPRGPARVCLSLHWPYLGHRQSMGRSTSAPIKVASMASSRPVQPAAFDRRSRFSVTLSSSG